MGEILPEDDLPLRYCGLSSCFRREAGTAGKDTRGIFRTHQFDKVEMFSFCHPERSWDEHEQLLSIEREIADDLGLHYRVMNISVGDLGAPAAKKYDIEAWLPGPGPLPRADVVLEHDRLPGAPARRALPQRGGRAPPAHAQRHGDHLVAHAHRRSSRPTSAPTAASSIPEILQGFGAPAEIRAAPR